MPEDKKNIRSDLIVMAKLNKQIDFDNVDSIKSLMLALNKKEYFKTSLKTKYISVLENLCASEDYTPECIVCKNKYGGRRPICPNCEKTIIEKTQPQKQSAAKQESKQENITDKEEVKKQEEKQEQEQKLDSGVEINESGTKDKKKLIPLIVAVVVIIGIIRFIGLWKILGLIALGVTVYQAVKYFKAKDQPKKIIKVVIPLVCAIALLSISGGHSSGSLELFDLMGADQEVVYKYFDKDLFNYRHGDLVYNEDGEPMIAVKQSTGKVALIYVSSNVTSDVSVCGIHIGDSREKVFKILEDDRYILIDQFVDSRGILNDTYSYIMKGNPYELIVSFDNNGVWCLSLTYHK